MSSFSITIVERPAVSLVGINTRTNMANAAKDCHELWLRFVPDMQRIFGLEQCPGRGFAYGPSWILDNGAAFDYWAAVEAPASLPSDLESGLAKAELPAGLYAECHVDNINVVKEAYTYIYQSWFPAEARYAPLYSAPCYEFYRPDFMATQALTIYCPVVNKDVHGQ